MFARATDWAATRIDRLKQVGLVVALGIFLGGLYLASQALEDLPDRIEPGPLLLLIVVGAPVTIALNVAEFWLMTRVVGHAAGWRSCFEITVFASAANMFSFPGSVVTRIAALRAYGTTLGRSSQVMMIFAGAWAGVACCYSGAWLVIARQHAVGASLMFVGVAGLVVSVLGFLKLKTPIALVAKILTIRIVAVVVEAVRNVLSIYAVGYAIGFGEASVFAIASVIGTAISVIPAGIGVSEAVAALLASLIAVSPAIGFLSLGINRIVFMVVLSGLAGLLLLTRRKPSR